MVLRALLLRHENELKLFRRSARRPGFAQELGALLGGIAAAPIHARQTPRALRRRDGLRRELRDKLHDLALLHEKYADWLART